MPLPAGRKAMFNFKGPRGATGSLAFATAEKVPWTAEPKITMVGPASNRGAHFELPIPLPTPEAVNNDDATEALVLNPTKTGAAVAATAAAIARVTANYANEATAGNLRGVVAKLIRGVSDVHVLWVTDSLGSGLNKPPHLNAIWLGQQFPAYSVNIVFWDEASETGYKPAQVIQTGTGPQTLTIWVACKSGGVPEYFLGGRYQAAIAAVPADAVIVLHSHNMGGPVSTAEEQTRKRIIFLALTETITATHPLAGLVFLAENPSLMAGRETWQAHKTQVIEQVAGLRGFGFIDAHQAFWEYGNWAADLMQDQTHPNLAGYTLMSELVNAAMETAKGAVATRLEPSTLLRPAKNYLPNGDFSAWAGAAPDGWTAVNATVSKDITNYETGVQAAKVTGTATAGAAQLARLIGTAATRELRGHLVTLAVRLMQPVANDQSVSVGLFPVGGGIQERTDVHPASKGGYQWVLATMRVDPAATDMYVRLYSRLAGSALVEASFDRAYLVKGVLPYAGS